MNDGSCAAENTIRVTVRVEHWPFKVYTVSVRDIERGKDREKEREKGGRGKEGKEEKEEKEGGEGVWGEVSLSLSLFPSSNAWIAPSPVGD